MHGSQIITLIQKNLCKKEVKKAALNAALISDGGERGFEPSKRILVNR